MPWPVKRGAMLAATNVTCVFSRIFSSRSSFSAKSDVVVFQLEAEEREGLDEGAAAGHDLGAAADDQVERREFLEDAHRIGGAEDGDGAGQADMFSSARRRRQG